MSSLNLSYYYGQEADQYSFYRIPKSLFTDPAFATLSLQARVLYGLMLDRMSLSIKNGWADPQGRIYIYFTLDEACGIFGTGHAKMVRVMNELDCVKGMGLIERKKQGQGKPTIIYVKNFASVPQTSPPPMKPYGKPDFKNAENQKSDTLLEVDFASETPCLTPQTSQIEQSGSVETESLDLSKRDANKTKKKKTEKNETDSLSHSVPLSQDTDLADQGYGESEGETLEIEVLDALYCQDELPYAYTADEKRMTQAIHILTGYDDHLGDSFEEGAYRLFNQALIAMLTDPKPMTLRGATVTYAKVYDKLKPYLDFRDTPTLRDLPDTAVADFITACRQREIRNHLGYMKSCIWYAMQVGGIAVQAQVERDFNPYIPTEKGDLSYERI